MAKKKHTLLKAIGVTVAGTAATLAIANQIITKKEKCDIFRFRTRIAQKYPELSDIINSDDFLSSIDYKILVTADAGRIGQMTMH